MEAMRRDLPSELRTSSVSGKRVLAEHLVSSSLSDAIFLADEGNRLIRFGRKWSQFGN